jgi:hypothetical protein
MGIIPKKKEREIILKLQTLKINHQNMYFNCYFDASNLIVLELFGSTNFFVKMILSNVTLILEVYTDVYIKIMSDAMDISFLSLSLAHTQFYTCTHIQHIDTHMFYVYTHAYTYTYIYTCIHKYT